MSFKKMETNFSFTDISLFSSLERNRAIKRMQQINQCHCETFDFFKICLAPFFLSDFLKNQALVEDITDRC